jgi:hypothetical protein
MTTPTYRIKTYRVWSAYRLAPRAVVRTVSPAIDAPLALLGCLQRDGRASDRAGGDAGRWL